MNFLRLRRARCDRGADRLALDGAEIAMPDIARSRPPGRAGAGVRPEHIRFDDGWRPARRGLRRRVSRHHPDRHGRHRGGPAQGAPAGRPAASSSASRSASTFRRRAAVAVRQGERPRASRIGAARGSAPMAEVRSSASPSASARPRRSTDLSLDIADGEFVVLLGPTGAGKTTTLRLVAGLEKPDAGAVAIGGRDVTDARAGRARRRLRVPAVFALSASVACSTIWPSRCARRRGGCPRPRSQRGCDEVATLLRIAHKLDNQATAALGRRDAARRDRPGAGAAARRSI